MLHAPHSAASENSVYGIQHFFWLCTVDSLRRMHSYSLPVRTKQKIDVAIKWNFEFAYSFRVWSWHSPAENQRVSLKLWTALPPQPQLKAVHSGIKQEHHTLNHKQILACSRGTPCWRNAAQRMQPVVTINMAAWSLSADAGDEAAVTKQH